MTPNEIFETAVGWMAQTRAESEDLAPFVPGMLNLLLAEALPYENILRTAAGRPQLARAPRLGTGEMDRELDYHETLVRVALPYGLAADLYREDENYSLMEDFRSRYVTALQESVQAVQGEAVRDVYR